MKKTKLFAALFGIGMLSISSVQADDVVTLTTSKAIGETITFQVNQLKSGAVVDWGDGTTETIAKTSDDELTITGTLKGQTITITSASTIRTLICPGLDLTAINITKAKNLCSLYCQNNSLTELNIASNKALTDLNCANNKLTSLSLTENTHPSIENLNIANNSIKKNGTGSDNQFIVRAASLQHVNVSSNQFDKVTVATANTQLDQLECANNNITSISITNTPSVTTLVANGNPNLKTYTNKGKNSALKTLVIDGGALTKLDLTTSEGLSYIDVRNNQLANIDFGQNKYEAFLCGNNQLSLNSLPNINFADYVQYEGQAEFINIPALLDFDDATQKYYMLIAPAGQQKYLNDTDYALDLYNYLLDGTGGKTITATFYGIPEGGTEHVKMEMGSKADYYTRTNTTYYGKHIFLTPQTDAYAQFSSTGYPNLVQQTTHFDIVKSVDGLVSGINDIKVAEKDITVVPGKGKLTISAPTAQEVSVVNAQGRLVWKGSVDGTQTVSLPTGVYIVNNKKVLIF